MRSSKTTLLLAAFGLGALVSIGNAACSSPTDVDSGTSEAAFSGSGDSPYATGYGTSYGYSMGVDLADDSSR